MIFKITVTSSSLSLKNDKHLHATHSVSESFWNKRTHKVLVAIAKRLILEGGIETVTVHEYSGRTYVQLSKDFNNNNNNNKIQEEMHLLVHVLRFENYWRLKN